MEEYESTIKCLQSELAFLLQESCNRSNFPSRPGKPICNHYQRTANCGFGPTCKYDHPIVENTKCDDELAKYGGFCASKYFAIVLNHMVALFAKIFTNMDGIVSRSLLLVTRCLIEIFSNSTDFGVKYFIVNSQLPKLCELLSAQSYNEPIQCKIIELETIWIACERSLAVKALHSSGATVDALTRDITGYVDNQIADMQAKSAPRSKIVNELLEILDPYWRGMHRSVTLQVFGSAGTSLGSSSSDVDLSLSVSDAEINCPTAGNLTPDKILEQCEICFRSPPASSQFSVSKVVLEARVPIIRLNHLGTAVDVDICIDNTNALRNTKLLREYVEMDSRLRPLVLAVKLWASRRGVNDPQNATLTSYGWTIMVIWYLQEKCSPAVLPRLLDKTRDCAVPFVSRNTASVGQLLIGFFVYYGTMSEDSFDYMSDVVSIQHRDPLVKQCARSAGQPSLTQSAVSDTADVSWRVCIEDPCEDHDLGRVVRQLEGQEFILSELHRVVELIVAAEDSDSDSDCSLLASCTAAMTLGETSASSASMSSSSACQLASLWQRIIEPNQQVPQLPFTCRQCGSLEHRVQDCPFSRCHTCQRQGHQAAHCPQSKCARCQQRGHFARDCTSKHKAQTTVTASPPPPPQSMTHNNYNDNNHNNNRNNNNNNKNNNNSVHVLAGGGGSHTSRIVNQRAPLAATGDAHTLLSPMTPLQNFMRQRPA